MSRRQLSPTLATISTATTWPYDFESALASRIGVPPRGDPPEAQGAGGLARRGPVRAASDSG